MRSSDMKGRERQMPTYIKHSISLEFETNRVLTEAEIDTLRSIIALQVEEPQNLEGNDETWTAQNISTGHSVIVRGE
jgi:hypothetical protein